ncbi:MAG TPA: lantibiotic ABC transporter permease [Syntrophomonas sp.]|nr:lantibiotic ABC transporter permease [Syntrophomonas sp.]
MAINTKISFIKAFTAISFLIMVIVNALANILPINDLNTGQVSELYPNLFAPAALTFSIWGLIFLLLAGYTLYQLGFFRNDKSLLDERILNKASFYFSISSIANAAWIFTWHYLQISLSMLLMIIILICLIKIVQIIKKEKLSFREKVFVRLPFSIYFGWITVATIANFVALLVSLGWNGLGTGAALWTVVLIIIGLGIGIAMTLNNRDIAYGLVFIWAYTGILIKHTSASGFAGQYFSIITTVIICLALLLIVEAYLIFTSSRRRL